MANIWAVCKDPGGTDNLLPILPLLREKGHEVKLFLHEGGKGELAIRATGETYETAREASAVIGKYGLPHLLITSMCSGGGLGRDLIPVMWEEAEVPTVALQDFWGARLGTDFRNPLYHPDLICVNDIVGADIVRDVWGKDDRTRIVITGYPSFDTLARINREAGTKRGREVLGVMDELPIVFYPGQIWHAGRTLLEVVTALNRINIRCHLVITKHGRMVEAPEENEPWQEAERSFRWDFHSVTGFRYIREIILASRVVVGMYSRLQNEAAALGIQVISALYPDQGAAQFALDTGGVMAEFPLVTLGCSLKAENAENLKRILHAALTGELGLRTVQSEVFHLDGRNTERTVNAALSLL